MITIVRGSVVAVALLLCLGHYGGITQAQDPIDNLPVILWHGMGDYCCNPFGMGRLKRVIEERIPGIYVHSLKIGNNMFDEMLNGFLMDVNEQVEWACAIIANDTLLHNGYNSIGFSQGSQFLRGVAQKCPNPPMHNLISIGGQQQGVYGLPGCFPENGTVCDDIRRLLTVGAYLDIFQNNLVQAQYWHSPISDLYAEKSRFIGDINQERVINEDYRTNLKTLNKLVLVKFLNDTMVIPKDSQWFGFYEEGQSDVVLKMQDTPLYIEDKLGLKAMDEAGQIDFLETEGDHSMDVDWFVENIVDVYL